MEQQQQHRTAWERQLLIRDKNRPTVRDYIPRIFTDFYEMHGDRNFGDDGAIIGGIGRLNGLPCRKQQCSTASPRQDVFMKICKEIYQYRQMIFSLVKKDLRGRYKGSVLGFLWTFINPLMQLVVYTFVFTYIMKAGIDKYYLYLFVALIPWIFFSSAITGGSSSIVAQKDLIKKIYFPREVIPISYVTSCFVNMLLCFLIIFPVMVISGISLNPLALLCLPVIMIVEYFLALGMAMLSSAVTVYFRDLEHILGIITMVWMYMTPIFYSIDMIPEKLRFVYHINPMSSVISCYRDVLYYAQVPDLTSLLEAVVLGALFLVLGMLAFGKLKKGFAEEL